MSYVEGKTKNEILEDLYGTAQPRSTVHEQQKMAIFVRCTEDIEKAIDKWAKSSNKLGNQVFCLNIMLGIITVLGVVATLWSILGF
jgi:hypothetical protein